MEIKQFKVLIGYVSYTGETIQPGIYSNLEVDEAEARNKSMVVSVDSNVTSTKQTGTHHNDVKVKKPVSNYSDVNPIKEITLEPVITHTEVKPVKINTATKEELIAFKFVAEKTASYVIQERETKPFSSYQELNNRVPLRGKHKWEEVAVLDFELPTKTMQNTLDIVKDKG